MTTSNFTTTQYQLVPSNAQEFFSMQYLTQEVGLGLVFSVLIGAVILSILATIWGIIMRFVVGQGKAGDIKRWRERMFIQYTKSEMILPIETFLAILATLSCVIFLSLASQVSELPGKASEGDFDSAGYGAIFSQPWLVWTEFTITVIFTIDYFWHLLLAANKYEYIFSLYSTVDILTAINGYIGAATGTYFYGVEFLRVVKIYKYIHILPKYIGEKFQGPMMRLVLVLLRVFCFVFTFLGFAFVTENSTVFASGQIVTLLDALYFVVVTLTTVGYGDITPHSITGKIVVIFMIVIGIIVFSTQISEITTLLREKYNRVNRKYRGKDHVVLFAHTGDGVISWLTEFFHPDREDLLQQVCVMIATPELDSETLRYLHSPGIDVRVDYIFGTALIRNDLNRCKLGEAFHAFILIDKSTEDKTNEDAKTILEVFSIHQYAPDIPISVQVFSSKHQNVIKSSARSISICINELKMGLITQSCLSNGFSTIISNLLISYSAPKDAAFDALSEYKIGLGHEIYVIKNLVSFEGMTFSHAANIIYSKYGGLLIGLCIEDTQPVLLRETSNLDPKELNIFNFAPQIAQEGLKQLLGSRGQDLAPPRKLLVNPGHRRKIEGNEYGLIICQDEIILHHIENFDPRVPDKSIIDAKYNPNLAEEFQSASIFRSQFDTASIAPIKTIEFQKIKLESTKDANIFEHIILSGPWPDIVLFIVKLRQYPLKKLHLIVILSISEPSDYHWSKLSRLPSIWFVQGAPTDQNDLIRAGVENADQVVILGGDISSKDVSADAKPLMTFRLAKSYKPFPLICIKHTSNLQFLNSVQSDSELENPAYAAGQVYLSGALDTLLCQTYFNEYIVSMVEQLCDGRVYLMSVEKCFPSFIEKPVSTLFRHLLQGDLLCLGFYRKGDRKYTLTNPDPNTRIRLDDMVYVLNAVLDSGNLELPLVEEEPTEEKQTGKFPKKEIVETLSSLFKPKENPDSKNDTEMQNFKLNDFIHSNENSKNDSRVFQERLVEDSQEESSEEED